MAKVTGYTAAKMAELADANIVAASLSGDNLILTTLGGTDIDVGSVRGAQGPAWLPQALNTAAAGVDWNSLTTPGLYASLMHGATNPNGPGATYANGLYYVLVYAYTTESGNVTQMAYPYQDSYPICYRVKFNGTWGAWKILQNKDPLKGGWWEGVADSTTSHTSGNWRTLPLTTKHNGELITMGVSGDNIVPPAGVWDVVGSVAFGSSGTGSRRLQLVMNMTGTSYNGTAAPTGTLLRETAIPGVSGGNTSVVTKKRRVRTNGTDKLVLFAFQDSTTAMTLATSSVQHASLTLDYIGP